LNSSAYRPVPNCAGTCWAATASTAAWICAVGMLGSKTSTVGPKAGSPAAVGSCGTALGRGGAASA
jgi:hypothetical protein